MAEGDLVMAGLSNRMKKAENLSLLPQESDLLLLKLLNRLDV
jgi:hypothetical protein